MNSQEDYGSFCFQCAEQALRSNVAPILTPGTQPLINTVYFPTPYNDFAQSVLKRISHEATPTGEDYYDLQDFFIFHHEIVHLQNLDWTPAKDLARIVLATCYAAIFRLLISDSTQQVESAWKDLGTFTQRLNEIEKSIKFVEELFANAWTFRVLEVSTRPGGKWAGFGKLLETLKENVLNTEEDKFPGFSTAYDSIQPLISLLLNNPSISSVILPLLQPIEEWGVKLPQAINAREHLERMLALPFIRNYPKLPPGKSEGWIEIKYYLEQMREKHFRRWKQLLALMLNLSWGKEVISISTPFTLPLWLISHGDLPAEGSYEDAMLHASQTLRDLGNLRSRFNIKPNIYASLEPRVGRKGQGFIGVRLGTHRNGKVDEDEADSILNLLLFEAIRQQLIARKGIICPFNQGRRLCQCPPARREALDRLYHIAKDTFFKKDELNDWNPLPCLENWPSGSKPEKNEFWVSKTLYKQSSGIITIQEYW